MFNYTSNDWNRNLGNIFDFNIPDFKEWTDQREIMAVLNRIGAGESSNRMFTAFSGSESLRVASASFEPGCIEISANSTYLLKAKSLSFILIANDPEWSYFLLETHEIQPFGVIQQRSIHSNQETLVELSPLKYIEGRYWDLGRYENEELSMFARPITRILKGSIVFFNKSSQYNQMGVHEDGRHSKMDALAFKGYVRELYDNVCEEFFKDDKDYSDIDVRSPIIFYL